ncbi:MAG: stage V sporulation protein AD [Thermacetogeniaceae bacterium]|jgi:stage V sporulation protein AD
MGQKLGRQSFRFNKPPVIAAAANIVGPMEGEGPLAAQFDWILDDILFGEPTWERAESKMLRESAKLALRKINWQPREIDFFLAGDLLDQIISANFAARGLEVPFLGLFGACSTFSEAIMVGSMLIDGGFAARVLVASGSHHNTVERQFRFPIEQGVQRPPYAQWTVTGSGALALADQGEGPVVTMGTAGKVVDLGISDPNNMGAAMAPAAADTLISHFQDTGTAPEDYDLILTGDLGTVGSEALKELMRMRGYLLEGNYRDCGMLIYDLARQDVHAGGSGCGCSSVVFTGSILNQLREGRCRKVLLASTGALLSPTSSQQGETIPGIAHAVVVEG